MKKERFELWGIRQLVYSLVLFLVSSVFSGIESTGTWQFIVTGAAYMFLVAAIGCYAGAVTFLVLCLFKRR